tara:strand:- start:39 stop:206 length:168 start_codon:yes stop_codon:yes gene_type:complete
MDVPRSPIVVPLLLDLRDALLLEGVSSGNFVLFGQHGPGSFACQSVFLRLVHIKG